MTFFSPLVCSRKVRTIVHLSSVYHISISSMHIFRMLKKDFSCFTSVNAISVQPSQKETFANWPMHMFFFVGRKSRNAYFGR